MDSMTDSRGIERIVFGPTSTDARINLGVVLGLDLDLALGFEYVIPDSLGDHRRREDLLWAFGEEYTRHQAFTDMAAEGLIDPGRSAASLRVLAGVFEDFEDEDDLRGYEEHEDRAWAA